ncbi:MAG: ABC transporter substrate-binding protein [Anaerolineales bacterium]|nr:ABC transporter substrate-binding protein [Anaerolineales bacterium]
MANNGHVKILQFTRPPQRVVSLVPSLTESLFDLGCGQAVVGITDYCVHPAESLVNLPRLGGPKNPRLDDIVALEPDLVLANQEENSLQDVEALEAKGVPVWVTFPKKVSQAMEVLWKLAELFRSPAAAVRLEMLERSLEWTASAVRERSSERYFCPIWYDTAPGEKNWWMTFNGDTYCHDLLATMGGVNIFAGRARHYPLEADLGRGIPEDPGSRDTRYPRITLEEIEAAQPEIILLPDEPFSFDQAHLEQLSSLLPDTPAVRNARVHLVQGSLITWHGTRLARALRELPALFDLSSEAAGQ